MVRIPGRRVRVVKGRVAAKVEIVVSDRRLVGVDPPLRHACDLCGQRLVRQRIVERARLSVKDEARRIGDQRRCKIGVARLRQRCDRVLHRIGVEVADNQRVFRPLPCRVRGEPIGEDLRRLGPGRVVVALTVKLVIVRLNPRKRALGFKVIDGDGDRLAARRVLKGLSKRRAVQVAARIQRVEEVSALEFEETRAWPQRVHRSDLVDHTNRDRIAAKIAGRDKPVHLGAKRSVHPAHQIGDSDIVVVLQLDEA